MVMAMKEAHGDVHYHTIDRDDDGSSGSHVSVYHRNGMVPANKHGRPQLPARYNANKQHHMRGDRETYACY
jgi:hypothetical protein